MSKTCNSCNTESMAMMPIAQHEKDQNRLMSVIKWLIVVIVLLVVFSVGSNAFWIWRDSQYEDVEETTIEKTITQVNDGGYNNYIGNDGDIVYG